VNGGAVLQALDEQMRAAGVEVSWSVSSTELVTIEDLALTRGVERLVAAAVRQAASVPDPPNYVTAFVRRWRGLRPRPSPAAVVEDGGSARHAEAAARAAELAELEARLREHATRLDIPEAVLRKRAREALVADGYPHDLTQPGLRVRLAVDRMACALAERDLAASASKRNAR
jgi:hypothetical protein